MQCDIEPAIAAGPKFGMMSSPTISDARSDVLPVYVVSGASRGLGRATAMHLASRQPNVAICARDRESLDSTAEACRAMGCNVYAEALDVADSHSVRVFADHVEETIGTACGLVNNAAVLGPVGSIDRVDMAEWRDALLINVGGVANMCAGFVPQMRRAGMGSIVNLSGGGIGGPDVQSFLSAYTTSKAAVAVLTETLATELAAEGIRVNAVAPGGLATELIRPVLDAGPQIAGEALYSNATKTYASAQTPSAIPNEFASLLDFLLSQDSAWVTGRLLSARWDGVEQLRDMCRGPIATSLYKIRRIDDALYSELPHDDH